MFWRHTIKAQRPGMSLVLTRYLEKCGEPPWTSFFIKVIARMLINCTSKDTIHVLLLQFSDVTVDHRERSHFNFTLKSGANYHILRTACFPYIKYHCTRRKFEDLSLDDRFFGAIKVINLGE